MNNIFHLDQLVRLKDWDELMANRFDPSSELCCGRHLYIPLRYKPYCGKTYFISGKMDWFDDVITYSMYDVPFSVEDWMIEPVEDEEYSPDELSVEEVSGILGEWLSRPYLELPAEIYINLERAYNKCIDYLEGR